MRGYAPGKHLVCAVCHESCIPVRGNVRSFRANLGASREGSSGTIWSHLRCWRLKQVAMSKKHMDCVVSRRLKWRSRWCTVSVHNDASYTLSAQTSLNTIKHLRINHNTLKTSTFQTKTARGAMGAGRRPGTSSSESGRHLQ
ncbi:unnamed protein product [Ectocarpus sp. 13 AM-2016]